MKIYLLNPIIELGKITFDEPIYVDLYYVDRKNKTAHFTWDFGMDDQVNLDCFIFGKLCQHSAIKGIKNKVIRICEFELGHAFFHPDYDPNYSYKNWALRGWFKDRIKLEEVYE